MRGSLKIALSVLAIFFVVLYCGLQYFKMEFADSSDYTETDRLEYYFYTPKLLKSMPRISNNYSFHYSNVSGPNPTLIYQVNFVGTADISKIEKYLEKNGYKKDEQCSFSQECWVRSEPNITVTIEIEDNPVTVHIEMVDNQESH